MSELRLASAPEDERLLQSHQNQASWFRWWLAGLPVLYMLSPLALAGLRFLRQIPPAARWLLAFFTLSQLLPALAAPDVALAVALALLRTALTLGLIGVGAAWGTLAETKWLGLGVAITCVVALGFSFLGGADLSRVRLAHPYMTSVSLGLAGATGIWLAAYAVATSWRWPLGLISLLVLLLSGSRGALIACVGGLVVGGLMTWRSSLPRTALLVLGALLGLLMVNRLDVTSLNRLTTVDNSGRDVVWLNTLSVTEAFPWSGVGPYQLGRYITMPQGPCALFAGPEGDADACPKFLGRLGQPWVIAHNGGLQALAESGPLGLTGLALLMGTALWTAGYRRDVLGGTLLVGILIGNLNDNTTLLPSPFFAELFWIVVGVQMRHVPSIRPVHGVVGVLVALGLSWPVLSLSFPAPGREMSGTTRLEFIYAPVEAQVGQPYQMLARIAAPPGTYRLSLRACAVGCASLETKSFTVLAGQPAPTVALKGSLWPVGAQKLELRVLSAGASGLGQVLGFRDWAVRRVP